MEPSWVVADWRVGSAGSAREAEGSGKGPGLGATSLASVRSPDRACVAEGDVSEFYRMRVNVGEDHSVELHSEVGELLLKSTTFRQQPL